MQGPCKRSKLGVFSSAFFGSRTARRTSDESAEDRQEVEPRADAPVTLEAGRPPETVERGCGVVRDGARLLPGGHVGRRSIA